MEIDANEIAKLELNSLDLSQVDTYPLFKACDETLDKAQIKRCFETELHRWITPYLDTLTVKSIEADTITLFLSVTEKGKLINDSIHSNTDVQQKIQKIFRATPALEPAIKAGVDVKVSFQMPVIIQPKIMH